MRVRRHAVTAAAGLLLALAGCGEEQDEFDPGGAKVGENATAVAFSGGSVWATDGQGLHRLDPESLEPIETPDAPGATVAARAGALWVADGKDTVARVDGARGTVAARARVENPAHLAAGDDGLFVANDRTLTKVSPAGEVGPTAELPPGTSSIARGDSYVWVANGSHHTVTRFDPRTLVPVGEPVKVGASPVDVAFAEGDAWIAISTEKRIVRIDGDSGRLHDQPVELAFEPTALAAGAGDLWAYSYADAEAQEIDLKHMAGMQPTPVGFEKPPTGAPLPAGAAVGADGLWVADYGDGRVLSVSP